MNIKQIKAFLVENQDKDYAWLSKETGKPVDSIRKMYRALGLPPKRVGKQNLQNPDPEKQFTLDMEKLRLSYSSKQTDKKYDVAMREIMRLRGDLETVMGVKDKVSTYVIRPSKKLGGEAVAVVVASDWHVEENVKPETVNGSNEYTMAIAKRRAEKFFQHTLQLVEKEQQAVHIETLCLALLGDFFSGNIHDELMETCEVQPQDAMLFAQNLVASGIEFLLANSKLNIIVPCAVGNHSRMTHKVHVSTEQGLSLEWAMYNFLALYFRNEKRVEFVLSRSYFNYVDIFGYKIRFHHGHAVNYGGGVGGLEVPMRKIIMRWDKDQPAYLSVCGHFHSRRDGGDFIVNGSLIGDSPYGKRFGFTGRAEQSFFLIDKKRGKTVVCPILLD
jgi:hypothetical protein